MNDMVETIIKKIKSLPPLPESVTKVREICDDPDGSIEELTKVIEQDPMFTADILKAANSPLYGFSRQITSLEQAVTLFGMGTIQGFAISYAIRKTLALDLSPYGTGSSEHLKKIASLQNALTLQWGQRQIKALRAEALTLSLLMELGKAVAAIVMVEEQKTDAFKERIKQAESATQITEAEKEILGISSDWIGALMFKHWQFSENMIEIMRHLSEPEKAPEALADVTKMLHVIKEAVPFVHPLCEACRQSAYEAADRYGFDAEALQNALDRMVQ